jgi:hypothetical protein
MSVETLKFGKIVIERWHNGARFEYTDARGIRRVVRDNPDVERMFESALRGSGDARPDTMHEDGTMPATNLVEAVPEY